MTEANFFVHFQFLGIEPEFFSLQMNEKVVARQKFLSAFDQFNSQLTMLTYSLSGIRADCDMLLVRVTENLELLQATFERLRAAGLGRYLNPSYTYLTTSESRPVTLGRSQYLFVCPWGRTKEWYALTPQQREQRLDQELRIVMKKPSLTLYTFESFGMEGQEAILACETNQPRDFLGIVKELKGAPISYYLPVASTFLCTRKDVRDMVETFG